MKSVQSDEARRTWRDVLNDVEHNSEHVQIMRYTTPAAVMVPVEWYEQARELMAAPVRAMDATGHPVEHHGEWIELKEGGE